MKVTIRFERRFNNDKQDVMQAIYNTMVSRYASGKPQKFIKSKYWELTMNVKWYKILLLNEEIRSWNREGYVIYRV